MPLPSVGHVLNSLALEHKNELMQECGFSAHTCLVEFPHGVIGGLAQAWGPYGCGVVLVARGQRGGVHHAQAAGAVHVAGLRIDTDGLAKNTASTRVTCAEMKRASNSVL